MNKSLFILLFLFGLTIMGCSKEGMSGEKPPEVYIKIGNVKYETKLGTYCWKGTCVDTAGPVDLLKGKEPIKVNPGERISFIMDYEPKPNEFHVSQISESIENEVLVKDNSFSVPIQKGVYYYSYGVWWMDEKEKNLSHGDAFYAFVLEVK
ncbi:hypothetical protein PH210_05165 [Paenibacillus sp. BSR1-1]|uniref:hypothetical protein n=1 Tax=Paenibacillus sp. BSR1-1 TaxID=3020845 RepID=UPI0025B1CA5A|nr:hypothetical protein [Paenibacillus sp. BSR1-1]MDN3015598.1 hypothetical protein [Paenibacillus sp. BSR1-1]